MASFHNLHWNCWDCIEIAWASHGNFRVTSTSSMQVVKFQCNFEGSTEIHKTNIEMQEPPNSHKNHYGNHHEFFEAYLNKYTQIWQRMCSGRCDRGNVITKQYFIKMQFRCKLNPTIMS
jgi:hypothetical protein